MLCYFGLVRKDAVIVYYVLYVFVDDSDDCVPIFRNVRFFESGAFIRFWGRFAFICRLGNGTKIGK